MGWALPAMGGQVACGDVGQRIHNFTRQKGSVSETLCNMLVTVTDSGQLAPDLTELFFFFTSQCCVANPYSVRTAYTTCLKNTKGVDFKCFHAR